MFSGLSGNIRAVLIRMATMQLLGVLFLLTWLGLNQFVEAYTPAPTYGTDALAAVAKINQEIYKAGSGSKCTPKNAYVRKEWSARTPLRRLHILI